MAWLRRFAVVAALLFWQGGGAFYGSVALHISREILAEENFLQTLITRDVTLALNRIGVAALAILGLDLLLGFRLLHRPGLKVGSWIVMAMSLATLFYLHDQMSAVYGDQRLVIRDTGVFWNMHKIYLWTTTIQFLAAMIYLGAILAGSEVSKS